MSSAGNIVLLQWRNGAEWARLDVDLTRMHASITCSQSEGGGNEPVWQSTT
jgi:hypothetical protein